MKGGDEKLKETDGVLTLYSTMQTKKLSGIRKKFMIVARLSSGMYCERIFMMLGQKTPTQVSKTRKPSIWKRPPGVSVPPFSTLGSKKSCEIHRDKLRLTTIRLRSDGLALLEEAD